MAKNYTALNKEERVCQYTICVSTDDTNSIASILRTASASNIKFCVAVIKDETILKRWKKFKSETTIKTMPKSKEF